MSQDPNPYGPKQPHPPAPDFAPPTQPFGQPSAPGQPHARPGQPQQPYGRPSQPRQPYGQPGRPVPEQSRYGLPPQPAADAPREDNPFAALLDLSFTQYATPAVVKVLYLLLVAVGGMSWIIGIVSGFSWSGASGLGALVGGGVALAAWILLVRVSLEFFLSIIRVAQDTQALREALADRRADRTPAATATTDHDAAPGNGPGRA